jgi:hypothetical protein
MSSLAVTITPPTTDIYAPFTLTVKSSLNPPVPGDIYVAVNAAGDTVGNSYLAPNFTSEVTLPNTTYFNPLNQVSIQSNLVQLANGIYLFCGAVPGQTTGYFMIYAWDSTSDTNSLTTWMSVVPEDTNVLGTCTTGSLAVDSFGQVYVAGGNVPVIVRLSSAGGNQVTWITTTTDIDAAALAYSTALVAPSAVAVDSLSQVYVANNLTSTSSNLLQFSSSGVLLQTVSNAAFCGLYSLVFNSLGDFFVLNTAANATGALGQLFSISFPSSSTSEVTALTVSPSNFCRYLAVDSFNNLMVSNANVNSPMSFYFVEYGTWEFTFQTPPGTLPTAVTNGVALAPNGDLLLLENVLDSGTPTMVSIVRISLTFQFTAVQLDAIYNSLSIQRQQGGTVVVNFIPVTLTAPTQLITSPAASSLVANQPFTLLANVALVAPPVPGNTYALQLASSSANLSTYLCPSNPVVGTLPWTGPIATSLVSLADGSCLFTDNASFASGSGGALTVYRWVPSTQAISAWLTSATDPTLAASGAMGLAVDSSNRVYVACQATNIIRRYNADASGGMTWISTQLNGPVSLAFDGQNNLYVANRGSSTVSKFSSAGYLVATLTSPQLYQVSAVGVNSLDQPYVLNGGTNPNTTAVVGQLYFLNFFAATPSVVGLVATIAECETVSMAFDFNDNIVLSNPTLPGGYVWLNANVNQLIPSVLPSPAQTSAVQAVCVTPQGNVMCLTIPTAATSLQLVEVARTYVFSDVQLPQGLSYVNLTYADQPVLPTFSLRTGPAPGPTPAPGPGLLCFREGTQLLTSDDGQDRWVPVEQVANGMSLRTVTHGDVPVVASWKTWRTPHAQPHHPDNLYRLRRDQDPRLIDDLWVTGSHSLLHETLTPAQEMAMKRVCAAVTQEGVAMPPQIDGWWKLAAMFDPRLEECREEPAGFVYHVALMHDDPAQEFGIWANGVLAETVSLDRLTHPFSRLPHRVQTVYGSSGPRLGRLWKR